MPQAPCLRFLVAYDESAVVGPRRHPTPAKRLLRLWSQGGRRPLGWTVRQALGAKVRILRCAPERSRSGLRNRIRRMAGADSGMRPPRHGHVAAVDRMESALGLAPIDAGCAVRADR